MLISRRKEGETLCIGDDIEIRVVSVRGKKVILGIVAPRDLKISTGKLTPAALANTMAAVHTATVDEMLHQSPRTAETPVLLLRQMPDSCHPMDDKDLEELP